MEHRTPAGMTRHEFLFALYFAQIYPRACCALDVTPAFDPLPVLDDMDSTKKRDRMKAAAERNQAHYRGIIEICEAAAAELPERLQKWILFGCGYDIPAETLLSDYGMEIVTETYSRARIAFYKAIEKL